MKCAIKKSVLQLTTVTRLLLKWTVTVSSNYSPWKDGNIWFTIVPLKPLFDQGCPSLNYKKAFNSWTLYVIYVKAYTSNRSLCWGYTERSVHCVLHEFRWFSRDLSTKLSLLDEQSVRFNGYPSKSAIVVFAWKNTSNYAYSSLKH